MNKILTVTGLTFVCAIMLLASASHARAESPNILVGNNLMVGSSGQAVVVLQGLLSEMGYLNVPAGIPFGYYGSLTQAAVAKYQASLRVTPAVGYYGPLTKVAMFTDFSSHGWVNLLGWNK